MTKRIVLLPLFLLLIATAIEAKRYLITCALPGSCPVTVYVDGVQYTLTKATAYAVEGEGVIDIELPEGKHTIQAFDKEGYEIGQISQNHVLDEQGNVEYLRVILGGSGYNWKKSEPNDLETDATTSEEGAATTEEAPTEESLSSDNYSLNMSDYGSESSLTTKQYLEKTAIEKGADMFSNFGKAALGGMSYDADGYPNVQLCVGLSRYFGEFARLKGQFGGASGFILYGGVGKDWLFDLRNKDRLSWHAGMGYYITADYKDQSDFSLGISYAETPVVAGGAVGVDLDYSYFFGRTKRFGFFVGGSAGVGEVRELLEYEDNSSEKSPGCFVWDLRIGLSLKLWQE